MIAKLAKMRMVTERTRVLCYVRSRNQELKKRVSRENMIRDLG